MKDCTQHAVVFSKPNCPECVTAKKILEANNICIDERVVGIDASVADVIEAMGRVVRSVPQIILDGTPMDSVNSLRETLQSQAAQ